MLLALVVDCLLPGLSLAPTLACGGVTLRSVEHVLAGAGQRAHRRGVVRPMVAFSRLMAALP